MKIFDLDKEKGGLKIEQRGGGMQTKSLRLKDANGHGGCCEPFNNTRKSIAG
jgi:hypothetical protein